MTFVNRKTYVAGDLFGYQTANNNLVNSQSVRAQGTPSIIPLGGSSDWSSSASYSEFTVTAHSGTEATIEDVSLPISGVDFENLVPDANATYAGQADYPCHIIEVIDNNQNLFTSFPIVSITDGQTCVVADPSNILQNAETYRYHAIYNAPRAMKFGETHDGIDSRIVRWFTRPYDADGVQQWAVEIFQVNTNGVGGGTTINKVAVPTVTYADDYSIDLSMATNGVPVIREAKFLLIIDSMGPATGGGGADSFLGFKSDTGNIPLGSGSAPDYNGTFGQDNPVYIPGAFSNSPFNTSMRGYWGTMIRASTGNSRPAWRVNAGNQPVECHEFTLPIQSYGPCRIYADMSNTNTYNARLLLTGFRIDVQGDT